MAERKKVLVDSFYLLTAQTGIRTYMEETCRQASSGKGHHEYKIVPDHRKLAKSNFFRGRTSMFKNLLFHFLYFIWKQLILPVAAARYKADVIFCPDFVAPWFKTRATKVAVVHDAFFWEHPEYYNHIWLRYYVAVIRMGLRGRSLIVTTSEYSKSKLGVVFGKATPIEVVYQGSRFETSLGNQSNQSAVYDQYVISRKKYFLHVGVFEKRKNLSALVTAFDGFCKSNEGAGFKLVLVGQKGPKQKLDDFEKVQSLIDSLKLNDRVVVTGYMTRENLQEFYKGAFCYVFPSFDEGFGLPVLEAFSFGVPVLVSSGGALPEIGGEAAMVFDPNNPEQLTEKMSKLTVNDYVRRQMIEAGFARVQLFTWAAFFETLESKFSATA